MKGYRTVLLNIVAALPMLADVVLAMNSEGLQELIPAEWVPLYTLGVILANVYLRTITTTPLGRKA